MILTLVGIAGRSPFLHRANWPYALLTAANATRAKSTVRGDMFTGVLQEDMAKYGKVASCGAVRPYIALFPWQEVLQAVAPSNYPVSTGHLMIHGGIDIWMTSASECA